MSANPIDLVGGLINTANVIKADFVAWVKGRVVQVLADATELRNTNLAGQNIVKLKSSGRDYILDTADLSTLDDDLTCIISVDGKRFKIKSQMVPPTAISLGGAFSSSAPSHQFGVGLDLSGNFLYAQPTVSDISGVDTDGTLAANSDTRLATQKAIKTYVDTVAQGLDAKPSVKAATTANITLSGTQTVDGVALVAADRCLVKSQSTASQNGIYVVASGSWTRATDADSWAELPGAYVFVEQGTVNGDTGWTCIVDQGGTLGSTSVSFTQFAGVGSYTAGGGLQLTGTQFSVTGLTTAMFAANVADTDGTLATNSDTRFATQKAVKTYVDAQSGAVTPALARGFLSGLGMSTAGSSTTMTIAAGVAVDSTNAGYMSLASAISKTTSSWAVGSTNGGLDTGTIANSTWYHFFEIKRTDTNVVDVVFSTSASAPTMPTNYTLKRRIGSGKTNGSGQWVKFTQLGDEFLWDAVPNDANGVSPGTSGTLYTLTVPPGVQVLALVDVLYFNVSGSTYLQMSSPDITAPSSITSNVGASTSSSNSTTGGSMRGQVRSDTSARVRATSSGASSSLYINTLGWIDRRGRDG